MLVEDPREIRCQTPAPEQGTGWHGLCCKQPPDAASESTPIHGDGNACGSSRHKAQVQQLGPMHHVRYQGNRSQLPSNQGW